MGRSEDPPGGEEGAATPHPVGPGVNKASLSPELDSLTNAGVRGGEGEKGKNCAFVGQFFASQSSGKTYHACLPGVLRHLRLHTANYLGDCLGSATVTLTSRGCGSEHFRKQNRAQHKILSKPPQISFLYLFLKIPSFRTTTTICVCASISLPFSYSSRKSWRAGV